MHQLLNEKQSSFKAVVRFNITIYPFLVEASFGNDALDRSPLIHL
jgi:hypothetical protein